MDPQISGLIDSLPTLTKDDVDIHDYCPICFVDFKTILDDDNSDSEDAKPAGLTRLGCSHVFCWKDLLIWIHSRHGSCPTCRNIFLSDLYPDSDDESDGGEYDPDYYDDDDDDDDDDEDDVDEDEYEDDEDEEDEDEDDEAPFSNDEGFSHFRERFEEPEDQDEFAEDDFGEQEAFEEEDDGAMGLSRAVAEGQELHEVVEAIIARMESLFPSDEEPRIDNEEMRTPFEEAESFEGGAYRRNIDSEGSNVDVAKPKGEVV